MCSDCCQERSREGLTHLSPLVPNVMCSDLIHHLLLNCKLYTQQLKHLLLFLNDSHSFVLPYLLQTMHSSAQGGFPLTSASLSGWSDIISLTSMIVVQNTR